VLVHPHLFRSALGQRRDVIEYQVRQTPVGADVAVRYQAAIHLGALREELQVGLARLGLPAPEVSVRPVPRIDRHDSGKLKRFLPLGDFC
jgi:phenylacetate-CoA ligase